MQLQELNAIEIVIGTTILICLYALIVIKIASSIKRHNKQKLQRQKRIKNMSEEERQRYYQEEANKAIIRMEKYWRGR